MPRLSWLIRPLLLKQGGGGTISDPSVTLSGSFFTYTGEEIAPDVRVTPDGIKLTQGIDDTVSSSHHKSIGISKVTIKGTGNDTGKLTAAYKIRPAQAVIESATWTKSTSLTLVWSKVSGSVSAYQIREICRVLQS